MSEPNLAYSSLSAEAAKHSDGESLLDDETASTIAPPQTERQPHSETKPASTESDKQQLSLWATDQPDLNVSSSDPIAAIQQQAAIELERQRQHWVQVQETLLAELRQARSQSHSQIERIRHLEQALDQSLASLNEVRLQVVDQQLLEAQLASTEEISNIQQQAIARLKLQLAQQQQALDLQFSETQARDRTLQDLLSTMETLTQAQQQELEQLRRQIAHDRVEVQAYQQRLEDQLDRLQIDLHTQQARTQALESQSLDAQTLATNLAQRLEQAHTQVNELSQILSDRQAALAQLEIELQQAHIALQEQQALIDRLQQSRLLTPPLGATPAARAEVPPDLAIAQTKIAALENQVAKQTTTQAMLQHACQELEEERDRQQARTAELESQTADMQEQILRQAQQASEYETAVQHWKDRCLSSHSDLIKLKQLLEQVLPDPPAELAEVLAALVAATDDTTEPSSPSLLPMTRFSRESKVDLPDFLIRRRNHKTRRT